MMYLIMNLIFKEEHPINLKITCAQPREKLTFLKFHIRLDSILCQYNIMTLLNSLHPNEDFWHICLNQSYCRKLLKAFFRFWHMSKVMFQVFAYIPRLNIRDIVHSGTVLLLQSNLT